MSRVQTLDLNGTTLHREDDDEVLYFLAGRRLYAIGGQSGAYPPLGWRRPGFIIGRNIDEVGPERRPVRAAHLLNEMGGIWAHPTKLLDGFFFSIVEDDAGPTWRLDSSSAFFNYLSHIEFHFACDGLEIARQDFVAENDPALFCTLTIVNRRASSARFAVHLRCQVNMLPAWFSGWTSGADEVALTGGAVTAYDSSAPDQPVVVFGAPLLPSAHEIGDAGDKRTVTLIYQFDLAPGANVEAPFVFLGALQHGLPAARTRFQQLVGKHRSHLQQRTTAFRAAVLGGPRFESSDPDFTFAYYLAKANMELLLANLSSYLGQYFFAGVPEYVQLFGVDTCYSVPGLVSAGFASPTRDALALLLRFARQHCGRVPHEVTTNGRVFHPGLPPETPLFAIACWNYFRWTGDRAFLNEVYAVCEEGLIDYIVAFWDADLDFYPDGQSMIERRGVDGENVDSVAYFCQSLYCLAAMAETLGHREKATYYRDRLADVLRESLNHDFWMDEQSVFADSLDEDHKPRQGGYWTVVVPLETDMADVDKAERTLSSLINQPGWLTEDGLVHTRGKETLVWSLPTGMLARVAFTLGRSDVGLKLLRSIAESTKHGTLGAFHEVIPDGLCFVQLWSAAIFVQGIVEGIFGLNPFVHEGRIEIFPHPPDEWSFARIEGARLGDREITVDWSRKESDKLRIQHTGGARLNYTVRRYAPRGTRASCAGAAATLVWETKGSHDVLRLDFALEPEQKVEIVLEPKTAE